MEKRRAVPNAKERLRTSLDLDLDFCCILDGLGPSQSLALRKHVRQASP